VFLFLCAAGAVHGQEESIHWAYASYFGTGRYSLDGQLDTTVVGFSPGRSLREPRISESGKRQPGLRIRVPISLGAQEFSSLGQIGELSLDRISAISVVPGVEIEIPMSERWSVKSLAYLGLGSEPGNGINAKIFRFAFRSRLSFQFDETRMQLLNGVGRIGYSADNGASDAISFLLTGLDFSRPLKEKKIGGDSLQIHWHVLYTNYVESFGLDLAGASIRPGVISAEWELGTAIGKQEGRIGIGRLKMERIGLAYRFGSDGRFSGIGITFRSLFDR
jgi:hypothetical protein